MKIKLPSLQNQILLALLLGAIFGAVFNVQQDLVYINYAEGKETVAACIESWEKIEFIVDEPAGVDSVRYDSKSQLEIIAASRRFIKEGKSFQVNVYNFTLPDEEKQIKFKEYTSVISIKKEKTIATGIKWLGDIFIRLLNMIAIPLVLASLIGGAASLGDIKKLARIGGKTIGFYIATTAVAITIGLFVANIIKPGERMAEDTKNRLMSVYQEDFQEKIRSQFDFDFGTEIANIIPKNPIEAMASSNMVQIVFFAVMVGLILTMIRKEKAAPVLNFFDGLSDVMIKMVDVIMIIAPIGVFALIASTVSEFGFEILETLIWYTLVVIFGLALHTFGTYGLLIRLLTKVKYSAFFKGIRRAQTIAFSTSSSAATLPVTMECCQDNLGISKSITSFVLPLGATINMDGTALYQGVAAVFIAQVFGFDLTISQQLTIVFTAVLASIGTAPVPGVGIIMLIIILKSVGIPQEGIALILGMDRILDMCRTVTNITGDALAASFIASTENEIAVES